MMLRPIHHSPNNKSNIIYDIRYKIGRVQGPRARSTAKVANLALVGVHSNRLVPGGSGASEVTRINGEVRPIGIDDDNIATLFRNRVRTQLQALPSGQSCDEMLQCEDTVLCRLAAQDAAVLAVMEGACCFEDCHTCRRQDLDAPEQARRAMIALLRWNEPNGFAPRSVVDETTVRAVLRQRAGRARLRAATTPKRRPSGDGAWGSGGRAVRHRATFRILRVDRTMVRSTR